MSISRATTQEESCNGVAQGLQKKEDAVMPEIAMVLIEGLRRLKGDQLCVAMHSISSFCEQNDEYKDIFGREGAVEAVIAIMEDVGASAELEDLECLCLSTLAALCQASEANCRRMGSKGVDVMVCAMFQHHTNPLVQRLVRTWLEDHRVTLYRVASKHGFLAMVINAMSTYKDIAEVQAAAIYALGMMIEVDGEAAATKILEKAGLHLALESMKMHEKDVYTQVSGLCALCRMVILPSKKLAHEIKRKAGVASIFKAFEIIAALKSVLCRTEQGKKNLLTCCIIVNEMLYLHVQHRTLAARNGCITSVHTIMSSDLENLSLQKECLQILSWFIKPDPSTDLALSYQRLVDAGIIPHLVEVIQRHPKKYEVMEVACWVTEQLVEFGECYRLPCESAIPALVGALKQNLASAKPAHRY